MLRSQGVPVYDDVEAAASVLARLVRRATEPPAGIPELPSPSAGPAAEGYWAARSLLEAAGVWVVPARKVRNLEEARQAAHDLGYPVVLKAAALEHKSDAGGVVLDLADDAALERAATDLWWRLGPEALSVESMITTEHGVELLVGARRDPRFGAVAVVGLGGIYAEVLSDVAVGLAPVDEAGADRLIRSLQGAPLLLGSRGRPPLDIAHGGEDPRRHLEGCRRLSGDRRDRGESASRLKDRCLCARRPSRARPRPSRARRVDRPRQLAAAGSRRTGCPGTPCSLHGSAADLLGYLCREKSDGGRRTMPKLVDRTERREEVLEATWRLMARVGIDRVSIREIAAEAGYSTGVIAHYFENKQDVLVSALRLLNSQEIERVARSTAGLRGLAALHAAIEEVLPVGTERKREMSVWMSFGDAPSATRDSRLFSAEATANGTRFSATCSKGRRGRRAARDLDCADEAARTAALIDGLSIQAMLDPERMTARRVIDIMDSHLRSLGAPERPSPRWAAQSG